MILLDTSGLLAALIADQRFHRAAASALRAESGPLLLSPFVLAELDYLLTRDGSQDLELRFLGEVVDGAYRLEPFTASDVGETREVIAAYPDLHLGLADASIVVLARKYGCRRVLTLDERHFRVVTGPEGAPFSLLPADSSG